MNLKRYGIYIYEEKFKDKLSKAKVRVIKVTETRDYYFIIVRLLVIYQGVFPKKTFKIKVKKLNNPIIQNFVEVKP